MPSGGGCRVTGLKPEEARKLLYLAANKVEAARQECEDTAEAIRSLCLHDWRYERDPSGNNDTGWSCAACGKWTRHKP